MAIKLSEKQIQAGWQIVRFDEIARSISKRVEPAETDLEVYVGLEHLDPQSLRIDRRGVPADVKGQKLRVRPGQIIFGKRRAYQKKLAVADFDGICSAHAMVLEAVSGKIIPELLPFFMQSDMFMDRAVAISEGSLSPTIKWKTLAIQEFPLPPLDRQKEILKVLEKVEETQIKLEDAFNIGQFSFKKALDEFINRIVKKSDKVSISEIGTTYGGLTGKKGPDFGSGEPFVTYLNVYNNYEVAPNEVDYVKIGSGEKQNEVKLNDILFTISSETPDEVGISSVVLQDMGVVYLNSFCFGLRLQDQKKFDPRFLKYFFRSSFFRREIRRLAQGSTRYNLSKKEFLKIKIPVTTLNEQSDIAEKLDGFSETLNILYKKIPSISLIKKSLYNSILQGGVNEL